MFVFEERDSPDNQDSLSNWGELKSQRKTREEAANSQKQNHVVILLIWAADIYIFLFSIYLGLPEIRCIY